MKKYLLILFLFLSAGFTAIAQEEEDSPQGKKIPERISEYIETRLGLTKAEAEKFKPVFLRYFREFVQIHRGNKGDRLVMQQKIIELRIRYRAEFRLIMDERKADRVFVCEDDFRREAMKILRENRRNGPPPRRIRTVIFQ